MEKVCAHDDRGVEAGSLKAIGNAKVDLLAKDARSLHHSPWPDSPGDTMFGPLGDAVLLLDVDGSVVLDVEQAFPSAWWRRSRSVWAAKGPRPRLDILFPLGLSFDWSASVGVFKRPLVVSAAFQHRVPPAVIKWTARVRSGCLATRERLHRHQLGNAASPACLCCGALIEDDVHVLSGCPATGSADWDASLREVWAATSASTNVQASPPPADWLAAYHLPLLAALIPTSSTWHLQLDVGESSRFRARLHFALAERLAETMRRRGELMAFAQSANAMPPHGPSLSREASSSSTVPGLRRPCPLPPERRLSVSELRFLETQRRQIQPPPSVPSSTAPSSGKLRRQWLRDRLVRLLQDDMVPCPAASGVSASALLALFERITSEPYTQTPGADVTKRIASLGRTLANLSQPSAAAALNPPLLRHSRQGTFYYNRAPKERIDGAEWRREQQRVEAAHPARAHTLSMADADLQLASWLRNHRSLRPVPVENGESGMALLLLWEVDHGCSFPSLASGSQSSLLNGFTRRLQFRVSRDPELSEWLVCRTMNLPLAPGLPSSHHARWSVQLVPPTVDAPWYESFLDRWKAYLQSLHGGGNAGPSLRRPRTPEPQDPAKRTRTAPPCRTPAVAAPAPPTAAADKQKVTRARSPSPEDNDVVPRAKRQSTLGCWLQPKEAPVPKHGRAAAGPPT